MMKYSAVVTWKGRGSRCHEREDGVVTVGRALQRIYVVSRREYKLSVREAWFDGTEGSLFISRGWEEVRSQSISGWALDDTSMQETPRRAGEISLCANFGFRSQVRKDDQVFEWTRREVIQSPPAPDI